MTVMEAESDAPPSQRSTQAGPAELGIWVFILGDLFEFALFFTAFLYYRALDSATFAASTETLNQILGLFNTLLLLFSSWLVVKAVSAVRDDRGEVAKNFLRAAVGCGIVFCLIKVIEYSGKFADGITITTNKFYMFYFALTGIHCLHVAVGIGVLLFLSAKIKKGAAPAHYARAFESGGAYWHMVDVIWLILFPLLYLVG